jgi:hypothetical protein
MSVYVEGERLFRAARARLARRWEWLMGRRSRKKKQFTSRYITFEFHMLQSAAFHELSGLEVKLLVFLCMKHNGSNNGQIACAVREAAGFLGCTPNTAARCFKGLQARGFAVMVERGAFSVKDRKATLWRLTMYPSLGGEVATRDYARWLAREGERQKQNTVSVSACSGIGN